MGKEVLFGFELIDLYSIARCIHYNTKQEYLGKFGSALYCSSVPYIFLVYINRVQTRTCIRALALGFGNKLVLWERKEVSIRSVPFMGKR